MRELSLNELQAVSGGEVLGAVIDAAEIALLQAAGISLLPAAGAVILFNNAGQIYGWAAPTIDHWIYQDFAGSPSTIVTEVGYGYDDPYWGANGYDWGCYDWNDWCFGS